MRFANSRTLLPLAAAALLATQPGASCLSGGRGQTTRPAPLEGDGRDDGEGRELPSGAQKMGEGKNRELAFTPAGHGTAFIYDVERRRVIDSVAVGAGKRFVFSPGADRASVGGERMISRDFDTNTNYQIYFSR